MKRIRDWSGREITVVKSRGGVVATADPYDNLIRSGVQPWPPPEILQKLYESFQRSAYEEDQIARGVAARGHYTDLQSLNSEDALT